MSRATTCGSSNTSDSLLIGPQPIFSASSRSIHQAVGCCCITGVSVSVTSWRLPTRAALVTKRGSSSRCVRLNASQKRLNVGSLPTDSTMWPSCGREHLIRHDVRMLVAQPRRVFTGRQVVHPLVRQPCHVRVQHADIDLLPLPGQVAMPQRRQDADAAVQPGEQVRHRHADLLRQSIRLAGQAHDAAHRLDQAVIARPRRIRPGLAEPGDRAIDQPRKLRVQLLVAQAVFRQRADLEVLHQDVAVGDQLQRDLLAFLLADIQRDRLLVAVDPNEIGALLGARA